MCRNSLAFFKIIIVHFFKILSLLILIFLLLLQYVGKTYLQLVNFLQFKKYICAFSYVHVGETHYLHFKTYSCIFIFKYFFYSIGQGKCSPILCWPLISLEMKINYPYLHDRPQKFKSARIGAYRIPGLRTFFLLFPPTFSYIKFLCNNRNRGY